MEKWSGEWAIRFGTRTDRNTPSSKPPEQSATAVRYRPSQNRRWSKIEVGRTDQEMTYPTEDMTIVVRRVRTGYTITNSDG